MCLLAPKTSLLRLIAGTCLILTAAGSSADTSGPAFDCDQASSQAEELICADTAMAALDRRMADRYGAALAAAGDIQEGAESAVNTLRAMQRGWIKGRDDCWKADNLRGCVEAAYLTREGDLVAAWMLEPPIATLSYTCDANPANEVTVYFFDTQRPSIRLEYGDSIASGSLVPAASGSKYAIAFGGMFWTKGDGAEFEWQEGKPMSCIATTP